MKRSRLSQYVELLGEIPVTPPSTRCGAAPVYGLPGPGQAPGSLSVQEIIATQVTASSLGRAAFRQPEPGFYSYAIIIASQ
jgi:hypothetical protein